MGELTLFCAIHTDLPPLLATGGQCCHNQQPSSVSVPPFLRAPLPLQHSMLLHLLCLSLLLISLRLQTGNLTSASDVCDLLAINPLVALHQNMHTIHSKSSNSHLILDSIFELPLLRILRKRELGFSLSSIIARHGSGEKTKRKVVSKLNPPYIQRASWGLDPKGGALSHL